VVLDDVILDDPLPPGHGTRRMRIANIAIKTAHLHCFYPLLSNRSSYNLATSMARWISTQIQRVSGSKGAWLRVTWSNYEILGPL